MTDEATPSLFGILLRVAGYILLGYLLLAMWPLALLLAALWLIWYAIAGRTPNSKE